MSDYAEAARGRVRIPGHLWVTGFVGAMWNGFLAYDHVMTNARDAPYIAQYPAEIIQAIDTAPVWALAAWAVVVWSALTGSILLMMRARHAVLAFALSLAAMVVSTAWQVTIDVPGAFQTRMLVMNSLVWAGAVLFVLYAWRMRRAGVLG